MKKVIVTVVSGFLSLGLASCSIAGKHDNNGFRNRIDHAFISSEESADTNYPSPFIEGSCEWRAEGIYSGNSFNMQESVPDSLSATWSATKDVGQKEYVGYAKLKVFDVAKKNGDAEDVVVDIDLRIMDLQSEPWTALNSQEQDMTFVYDDEGSRCIVPATCDANLDDIQGAIHLELIDKYPGGYTIEGDATFLGVFVKAAKRQDDLQEICGFYEVPEVNDPPQDSTESPQDSAKVPQDSTESPQDSAESPQDSAESPQDSAESPSTYGATYFIRPDGAPNGTCDGTADLPAPRSDGHCAWNHPFEAFPPQGSARIAGGDTLLIKKGSYRMGHTPNLYDSGPCHSNWPWGCFMSAIPSGPDKRHVTKIYGEGWDQGCSNPPELWGTEASGRIINLDGTSNVEIQCLEITDHAECATNHGGAAGPTSYKCIKDRAPTGDCELNGFYIKNSSNGLLKNVKIHGLSSFAIKTGALTDWTFDHVDMIGNGYGGFTNDIYGSHNTANSCFGEMNFIDVNMLWNGCVEKYPDDGQVHECYDQNQGGYGDGFGSDYTVGTWLFERVDVSFNSSDGIDLLYHRFDLLPEHQPGLVIVRDSYFEGNVGNSIKTRGNAIITNNMLNGNCDYFNPNTNPLTIRPNTDGRRLVTCRGNATSVHDIHNGADLIVANNSFTGQSDIMLTIGGKNMQTGGETAIVVNNIFYGGPHVRTEGKLVDGIFEWRVLPTFEVTDSNNAYFNSKGEPVICDDQTKNNYCEVDPKFYSIDFVNNNYDFHLQTNSPFIGKGQKAGTYIGEVSGISVYVSSHDFEGQRRSNNVCLGADEVAE